MLLSIAEAIRTSLDINARDGLQAREGVAAHTGGGVAILRLSGLLSQRPTFLSLLLGGTSTEEFSQRLRSAVADPSVSTIVMDVDSVGGGVHGIAELANEIYDARRHQRIIAAVNSMAASAAYWLISNAHEIAVTPSGELGSIGVFATHYDLSRANEKAGVKPTYVSAGKFKVENNPDSPLSDEAQSHLQKRVDEYYDAFVQAVARGRNVTNGKVRGGFGEGRCVGSAEAVRLGMADKVATLSDVVTSALSTQGKPLVSADADRRRRFEALINGGTDELTMEQRIARLRSFQND
jgi:signal peptide peptidase SppA